MDKGNETGLRQCRFLDEDYFQALYDAFTSAFSDYVIPFALTETQFRNHINLTGVDLSRTVGCLDNDKLIGFSLNGFGDWNGRPTVYDAGTGVVPAARRRGISEAMFSLMLPRFREAGIEQFLLEVITTNTGAINLYKKLGFQSVRTLALLQCDGTLNVEKADAAIAIRDIDRPDWDRLSEFWDGKPSWQNSSEAVQRSNQLKRVFGAFDGAECLGYIVFSAKFGRIAQIAVSKDHRRRGIGSALVGAMQTQTSDGFSFQVINIDTAIEGAMRFFLSLGFYERLKQYEMLKTIKP